MSRLHTDMEMEHWKWDPGSETVEMRTTYKTAVLSPNNLNLAVRWTATCISRNT